MSEVEYILLNWFGEIDYEDKNFVKYLLEPLMAIEKRATDRGWEAEYARTMEVPSDHYT